MDNFENIILWSRYLYRTCKIQEIAFNELDDSSLHTGIFPNEINLLYYGLLYVTIEAFNNYSFADKRINYLIGSKFKNRISKLRRLRNSLFHPDDSVYSQRQSEFFNDIGNIMPWVYGLTDEFERFLYFYPESIDIFGDLANEIREEIKKINNWLPTSSLEIVKNIKLNNLENYKLYIKDSFPEHYDEFCNHYSDVKNELLRLPDSYFEELL